MTVAIEIVAWTALLAGGAIGMIGGLGLLRLPDFYTRLHASGLTDTLCPYLILGGLMLVSGPSLVTAKLALIVFFLFLTAPVATHALANAARHGGLEPWTGEEPER